MVEEVKYSPIEDLMEDEYQKWGENGHRQMVDKIIHVEKALGINDLDSFTPKA